jgi:signal transduction histidine kinase
LLAIFAYLFYSACKDVKDTGIGIDKKHHDAIFNKFRQIDDTHTRKFVRMGIGLSIAKKTVEIMGGRI